MPTQDFKGTINGNTITSGTGTLTMAAGKTLTVNESATLTETPPLNVNVIKGDGTAGRVLRSTIVKIENATDAAHIKCTSVSAWNGDANGAQDNIGKDATPTGVWLLNVGGYGLYLLTAGIAGDPIGVLSVSIIYNASGTAVVCESTIDGTSIVMNFYNAASGATVDLTTLVDTGVIWVQIVYATSL